MRLLKLILKIIHPSFQRKLLIEYQEIILYSAFTIKIARWICSFCYAKKNLPSRKVFQELITLAHLIIKDMVAAGSDFKG